MFWNGRVKILHKESEQGPDFTDLKNNWFVEILSDTAEDYLYSYTMVDIMVVFEVFQLP